MDLFPISHVPKRHHEMETEISQLTSTQNVDVTNNDESAIDDQTVSRPMTQTTLSQITLFHEWKTQKCEKLRRSILVLPYVELTTYNDAHYRHPIPS